MKIHIQEHLNLKNITIDFSPPNGISDFYGPYISGVSCIIGKNGSGKSNILEQVGKKILIENKGKPLSSQVQVIYYAPIINSRQFDDYL